MSLENLINIIGKKEIISCEKGPYINLFLKPQKANGKYFLLRLFFEKGSEELKYCQIVVQDIDIVPSWKDWNMTEQLKIKENNDMWLRKDVGKPPYIFSWGELKSVYNAREASSYIIVKYD